MDIAIEAIYVHGMLGGTAGPLVNGIGEDIKTGNLLKVDADRGSGWSHFTDLVRII